MKMLNLCGKTVISVAVLMATFGADAAQSGRIAAAKMRMPTMPTTGLTTIGNPAVNTVNVPSGVVSGGGFNITPNVPNNPNPDNPGDNTTPDNPTSSACPDGKEKNSKYTITNCMNDLLQCVNTGALQGGLNDLFNEDVRNSIVGGMRLCQSAVDKCISDVRVNCRNVYNESTDVWLDFNSRIIQPEYYNFVLRKTGLTPNQAENTCLLLDRNTYGESFAAVSDSNAVNSEYNKKVGAYNKANNNSLSKDNPQGVEVNTTGYDGNRGHYARWDAAKGECLIRVAAYNKDKLITNSWLFGAVGNDNAAEVWEKAGSTFTCSKDLFDFSLMNDTKTAAVVGVGGGTLLGTAIGAGAGAAAYNKKHNAYLESVDKKNDPCTDEQYRKDLGAKIYASKQGEVLKSYAYESVSFSDDGEGGKTFSGTPIFDVNYNFNDLDEDKCRKLHTLAEKVEMYRHEVQQCKTNHSQKRVYSAVNDVVKEGSHNYVENITVNGNQICMVGSLTCGPVDQVAAAQIQQELPDYQNSCLFVPLQVGTYMNENSGVLCKHGNKCLTVQQIEYQINKLDSLLTAVSPSIKAGKDANKGKEIAKGAAIGAATGAGVGGIVTGITALVEKNNITCKVGDGLNSVALGKSHTIDSLKDFYVKWNLQLPDNITPTAAVTDRESWRQACSQFNSKLLDCPRVQVNYKHGGTYELIDSACRISGSICVPNDAVMNSHLPMPVVLVDNFVPAVNP
ncbi:MAG: hypothetical protein J6W08_01100 [Alphaproteobacteria bacterium]|nr:hypothetical protein [Alphaproteobacteria bacterium]